MTPRKKKEPLEEEKNRDLVTEYPIRVRKAIKDIKILNENGDATVKWQRKCENTCGRDLPKLVHESNYDGSLETCEVHVNDKKPLFSEERYTTKREEEKGAENNRLGSTLKLIIDLKREKIHHGKLLSYDYTLKYSGVFENMYKPHSEWTGYRVLVPTENLTILITAPDGSKFSSDYVEVRVEGLYEIEDFREEKRCREQCPPYILQGGNLLMWEIQNPKIACTYNLHFTLSKSG